MIDQELLTYLAEMESRIIGAIAREPEPKPPESFDRKRPANRIYQN
jgi:hypothetical protein